ncbi:MAG TPA: aldo/keto reductase, partial [Bacteroidales bacterium]|nr:aldo/keto reductase [Bacteroidales bacterium]
YTIAGRDIEREIVPMAIEEDISIMPWSPLAGGFLSGKYTRSNEKGGGRRDNFDFPPINKEKAYDIIDVLIEVGKNHNTSAAQVAIAWLLQRPAVTSVIIGAKKQEQLLDNIEATRLSLSHEELTRLNKISELPVEYPGWMLERQSMGRLPG